MARGHDSRETVAMNLRVVAFAASVLVVGYGYADNKATQKTITSEEAGKHVGEKVTVEMIVRASKDRLEKRKEIYLDSTTDHHDPKNLAAVVTVAGAASLKSAGIADPATYFKGKTIQVSGTVTLKEKEPRIEINEASQIRLAAKKE
jgi:DNA/RNA endonuclease YhcR with UshA esterase domain